MIYWCPVNAKFCNTNSDTARGRNSKCWLFLFLKVTSAVQHPTIKAPSTANGQQVLKKGSAPMQLCSRWKLHGEDKDHQDHLDPRAKKHGDDSLYLVMHSTVWSSWSCIQAFGNDTLWAGCRWIRGSLPGFQLRIHGGTTPHHPHSLHIQQLLARGVHQVVLPERDWYVIVL